LFVYGLGGAEAVACVTISIRVPLSRWTFFPADVIREPSVPLLAAGFRLRPFMLNTPRLFDVS
jgi:hypothetical protein